MVGKAIPPTKEEKNRLNWIGSQYGGCIPCLLKGYSGVLAEVHHVVQGNKRSGHEFTYGNCYWHHEGHEPARPGPSLGKGKRPSQAYFGAATMLCDLQTFLIEAWKIHFWVPYHIPEPVVRQLRELWVTLRVDDPYYEG